MFHSIKIYNFIPNKLQLQKDGLTYKELTFPSKVENVVKEYYCIHAASYTSGAIMDIKYRKSVISNDFVSG